MPDGLATAAAAPIVLDAIGKRYETTSGPVQAVDSVSLTVRREEFVAMRGKTMPEYHGVDDGISAGLAFNDSRRHRYRILHPDRHAIRDGRCDRSLDRMSGIVRPKE